MRGTTNEHAPCVKEYSNGTSRVRVQGDTHPALRIETLKTKGALQLAIAKHKRGFRVPERLVKEQPQGAFTHP